MDMFAYFDESMSRNWAGSNFWKSRAMKGSKVIILDQMKKAPSAAPKKVKVAVAINFLDDTVIDEEFLFAAPTVSINLSKNAVKLAGDHLLPDDLQFSSKRFTKLFLKPHSKVTYKLNTDTTWIHFKYEKRRQRR